MRVIVFFALVALGMAQGGSFGSFAPVGSFSSAIDASEPAAAPHCGDAYDRGEVPSPWEDFGNCATAVALGYCTDPVTKDQMHIGCAESCGDGHACDAPVEPCPYVVHISSGTWADEIHWAVESNGNDVYSEPGKYGNNAEFDEDIGLLPGTHTFIGYDVYGDGWNGGSFSVFEKDTGHVVVPITVFNHGYQISKPFTTSSCGPHSTEHEDGHKAHEDTSTVDPAGADDTPQEVEITVYAGDWSNELSWNVDSSETTRGGNTHNSLTGNYQNYQSKSTMVSVCCLLPSSASCCEVLLAELCAEY